MQSILLQLVLALVGGGAGGGLVSWWLESRSEHRRWLRDEKLKATSEFLNSIYAMSALMIELNPGEQRPPELMKQVTNSEQSRLSLIASRPVIEAAQQVTRSVADWRVVQETGSESEMLRSFAKFRDRITEFTVAVRSDLGTAKKDNPRAARRSKNSEGD